MERLAFTLLAMPVSRKVTSVTTRNCWQHSVSARKASARAVIGVSWSIYAMQQTRYL